jgi:hypothetical protein
VILLTRSEPEEKDMLGEEGGKRKNHGRRTTFICPLCLAREILNYGYALTYASGD